VLIKKKRNSSLSLLEGFFFCSSVIKDERTEKRTLQRRKEEVKEEVI